MKQLLRALTIVLSTWVASPLHAQPAQLGNWINYLGNKQLAGRWNLWHEAQLRNYNALGDLEQLLVRVGLGYRLDEAGSNLLLGYAYIHSENYVGSTDLKVGFGESRIYQQLTTRQSIGRIGLQHRYRVEQRFIEDDADRVRVRFRYFLGANIPLVGPTIDDGEAYLSLYDEVFVNAPTDAHPEVFDRNRVYAGIGYRFGPQFRLELAYMDQMRTAGRSRDQINVMAFVSF